MYNVVLQLPFCSIVITSNKQNRIWSFEEVKAAVSNWLRTQSTEFYAKGIDSNIKMEQVVAKEGDYVEK